MNVANSALQKLDAQYGMAINNLTAFKDTHPLTTVFRNGHLRVASQYVLRIGTFNNIFNNMILNEMNCYYLTYGIINELKHAAKILCFPKS